MTDATYDAVTPMLVATLDGQWDEARRLATGGLDAATVGHLQGSIAVLGQLARYQGEPASAWEMVQRLHPAGPDTEPGNCHFQHGIALQALAADLALDVGDLELAERWIDAHGRWLAWSGAELWQADNLRLRARRARATSDLATARAHAEAALQRASDPRQPLALLAAHRLLGELDTVASRYHDARAHLDASLALAEACAAPYERALSLLALAELRAAENRRDEAGIALDDARTILAPLGAAPALDRAAALAQRVAASPPAAQAEEYPFGLTAREVEVLRLVAEGLTDPQIAQRLFVSRNTVNSHLRAVYGKLGVNTRAAAARLATERGLA
jgi:ATP/maltotriose-dependent transcriptional regulator MalT